MPLDSRSDSFVNAPSPVRTRASLFAAASALVALGFTCHFDPARPYLEFGLAELTTAVDDNGDPLIPKNVQDHIEGSLEMLFGTPQNPQYMLLGDWIDSGYDPNWPTYAADDFGSGEFDEDQLAAFEEENARTFRRQLAAIASGNHDDVVVPDWAPDLERSWKELLEDTPVEERGSEGFVESAEAMFVTWYPSLRDSAELYRQQCLHCHGPEGGGNGPTADFLNPRPRDYRLGKFKFTPLKDKAVPRRQDIYRILDEGATGTAMPSFRRFSDPQLHGLVDYVRLLSMRGMVEADLRSTYEIDEAIPVEYVPESYADVFQKWLDSETNEELVVAYEGEIPEATPEVLARGQMLFNDATTGNCASCHGAAGRGDGISAYVADPERPGKLMKDPETGRPASAYNDDWGHPIFPRNITQGIFRGGRRPIDIFRRIKAGINGTPMPALDGVIPDEDIWAIVHYVGTLSESGLFYPAAHAAPVAAAGAGH